MSETKKTEERWAVWDCNDGEWQWIVLHKGQGPIAGRKCRQVTVEVIPPPEPEPSAPKIDEERWAAVRETGTVLVMESETDEALAEHLCRELVRFPVRVLDVASWEELKDKAEDQERCSTNWECAQRDLEARDKRWLVIRAN